MKGLIQRSRYGYFWQRPRTHREVVPDRPVSFLELFYDLVFVVLVARVAAPLHEDITAGSVFNFVVLFCVLWIAWFNGSMLHDAHGREDHRNRLFTFLQMFAVASMAVFASDAAGSGGTGFAISFTGFLLILNWQWWVVARLERDDEIYGPVAARYTVALSIMTVVVIGSIFMPPVIRIWFWAAFVLVFLALGLISGFTSKIDPTEINPYTTSSLRERYALFIIIVLGEVVASVVEGLSGVENLSAATFATGFAGLAIAAALWWTYFDTIAMRMPRPRIGAQVGMTMLNLPLVLAITGVGAATVGMIEHSDDQATPAPSAWLFGGMVALCLVTLATQMLLLDDFERLRTAYLPTVVISLVLAALALVVAWLQPRPLVLALSLFVGMCIQWAVALSRWLDTEDGEAAVEQLRIDSAQD